MKFDKITKKILMYNLFGQVLQIKKKGIINGHELMQV